MKILADRMKLLPFTLTLAIIIVDQAIKSWIVNKWPIEGTFIRDLFGNGFLQFYHVRNRAIAFSLGYNLPDSVRPVLFIILPIIVLCLLLWYYFSSAFFTGLQRWAIAGIVGGGMGNIIDRIFRTDGVVDYVSVRFYGIFGWDRWPTFNVADSSVVVCCIILLISIIFTSQKEAKNE
ncbi:MAG: signal peptidase II [Treponema sp.]|nr:signal peptidase II [Treponema sp.]